MRAAFYAMRARLAAQPQHRPIGLEFGFDRLNLVQCVQDEHGWKILAAVSVPYPVRRETLFASPKALRRFVDTALASAPFKGRRVISSLPASKVRIVPLDVQLSPGQSEQTAVIKALREKWRSDLNSEIIDYLKVRDNEPGADLNVLVIAAQRQHVLEHLELLEHAGLEPKALDIGPAALTRLITVIQEGNYERSVVLLNFGVEKTYITVLWGRRLMLDREMDFGESLMTAKLANALGVESSHASQLLRNHGFANADMQMADQTGHAGNVIAEILHPEFSALAEEVSRTLIYIASKTHGKAAECIFLNGTMAHYPGIAERMQKLVSIPVEILDSTKMLRYDGPPIERIGSGGIALATGLALRDE